MIKKIFLLLVVGLGFLEIDACRPGCGLKGLASYPQEYWDMKEALGNAAWGESPAGQPDVKPEELSVVIERYKSNPKWRHAMGTLLLDAIKGDNLPVVKELLHSMSKKDWGSLDFIGHVLPCAVAMREYSLEWSKAQRFYQKCNEPVRTVDVLRTLLDFGFCPNVPIPCTGTTPQHIAVERKDAAVLEILLLYGASLKIKDYEGNVPVDVWHCAGEIHDTYEEKDERVLDVLFRHCSKRPRNAHKSFRESCIVEYRRALVCNKIRGPKKSACAIQ